MIADRRSRVVGYHAITAAAVEAADATDRARRGMPRYPIPAVLLAGLAVDRSEDIRASIGDDGGSTVPRS